MPAFLWDHKRLTHSCGVAPLTWIVEFARWYFLSTWLKWNWKRFAARQSIPAQHMNSALQQRCGLWAPFTLFDFKSLQFCPLFQIMWQSAPQTRCKFAVRQNPVANAANRDFKALFTPQRFVAWSSMLEEKKIEFSPWRWLTSLHQVAWSQMSEAPKSSGPFFLRWNRAGVFFEAFFFLFLGNFYFKPLSILVHFMVCFSAQMQ